MPVLYISLAATETEKELEMLILKRPGAQGGFVAARLARSVRRAVSTRPPYADGLQHADRSRAMSVPPGAPVEDICYETEWPAPNGDLYNARFAHSTTAST